jgi:hypothetical protein
MKPHHRLAIPLLAAPLTAPLAAHAQAARLKLPDFSGLADKAKESVDISLDGDMLKSASGFMGGASGSMPPEVADAIAGVQGIYIRVFEFERPDAYSQRDLEGVRRQLQAPGWKKLMSVQSRGEHVDMFLRDPGSNPADGGLALVVSEPMQFVIVNIVGDVDLEKLRLLQGRFGVPGLPGMAPPAAPPALPAPAAPAAP